MNHLSVIAPILNVVQRGLKLHKKSEESVDLPVGFLANMSSSNKLHVRLPPFCLLDLLNAFWLAFVNLTGPLRVEYTPGIEAA